MEFHGKMPPLAQPAGDSNWVMPEIDDRGWQMKVSVPSPPPVAEQSAPSSGSRLITPTLLFVIVILAVVFFVSGLLHLLIRLLVKQRSRRRSSSAADDEAGEVSDSEAIQRQLQQLFHLHDSGLDQAFIDALPIFLYRELVGAKEPFDCAVCLCEFSAEDKLRLLPVCSHAFHLDCIDTWLLSNSTCPLCRGTLFVPGLAMENPIFDLEEAGEEGPTAARGGAEEGADEGKMVFSVRLGKFRSLHQGGDKAEGEELRGAGRGSEVGSSSSSLDRRCYSMGSYQYVVGESTLQVALSTVGRRRRSSRGGGASGGGGGGGMSEGMEGRRLCVAGKGESFSVSKIWQWSSRGSKYPMASDEASLSPWRVGGRGGGSHDHP